MADKFAGGILAGSVDVSLPVILRVKSDGAELTGKVATAVSVYYWRQSAVSLVEITAATLGSMGAVHSNGGWYEVDGTNFKGMYRLDLPDTAVSTGAEWVVVGVKDTAASSFYYYERFALETVHNHQMNTYVSGVPITIPNGHITSAKIGADAIGSDKVAAGALDYGDQIVVFDASIKSAASAAWAAAASTNRVDPRDGSLTNAVFGTNVLTAAVFAADCITSAKVAAGAFTYDDQITTFKSELSGLVPSLTGYRLSTQGVRDITQYTSAHGGFPGSSPALIDAIYWSYGQVGFKHIQAPTSYLAHGPGGTALASAAISGTSTQVTIGIFTNV